MLVPMALRMGACFLAAASSVAAAEPDWPAVRQEALETLVDLVRLKTAQPEGNEILAARYLKGILDEEGLPSEIFESAPSRASIVARVQGNGSKKPLLLLGHLDVVAVEPDEWSFDPFGGEVRDGILFARGSSDDKGVVTGSFHVLLELHRQSTPLDRDVIFMGVADEEAGGIHGINFMLDRHRDRIDAEFGINEAGKGVFDRDLNYLRFEIQTAEKTPTRIDLRAAGTSGHGSIPLRDNPIGALARAVARLYDHQMPPKLNETTREYFRRRRRSFGRFSGTVRRRRTSTGSSTCLPSTTRWCGPRSCRRSCEAGTSRTSFPPRLGRPWTFERCRARTPSSSTRF